MASGIAIFVVHLMFRVRVPVIPTRADLSELGVFISYKSHQWDRAKVLRSEMEKVGLKVHVLPPNLLPENMTPQEIRAELSRIIAQSDCLCVLASSLSVESDWVKFEFKEAAKIFGQILFVFDGELGTPSVFSLPQTEPTDLAPSLFVKHTTVCMMQRFDWIKELTVQLVNDPDEGWFDSSDSAKAFHERRNLKLEIARRKSARMCVLMDHKYRNRRVLDVLPFSWDEVNCNTIEGVFWWFIETRGRQRLREALANGEVDGFYTWYSAPGADFLKPSDDSKLHVLVITAVPPNMPT